MQRIALDELLAMPVVTVEQVLRFREVAALICVERDVLLHDEKLRNEFICKRCGARQDSGTAKDPVPF